MVGKEGEGTVGGDLMNISEPSKRFHFGSFLEMGQIQGTAIGSHWSNLVPLSTRLSTTSCCWFDTNLMHSSLKLMGTCPLTLVWAYTSDP